MIAAGIIGSNRRRFSVSLILDQYTAAFRAYGLRKLNSSYGGSAIIVRRAVDNDEKAIGFSGNLLDTADLVDFGSGTDCYVKEWYDQSGNGINVTQGTNANQPQIVSGGTVLTRNGKPVLRFDGSNDFLGGTDTGLPTGAASYAIPAYCDEASLATNTFRTLFSYGNASVGSSVIPLFATEFNIGTNGIGITQYGDAMGIANQLQQYKLMFFNKPASTGTWDMWFGASSASKSMVTNTSLNGGTNSFTIGCFSQPIGLGSYFKGDIPELIIWGDKSADRTGISTDINTYLGL
jgi:hypothetical protein